MRVLERTERASRWTSSQLGNVEVRPINPMIPSGSVARVNFEV